MKLERFGDYILARPDPQALWKKRNPALWKSARGTYQRKGNTGSWKMANGVPKSWSLEFEGLTLDIRPTSFKHVGLFPEQAPHWKWMTDRIYSAKRQVSILNLFAYTGGATLTAAKSGARVTHLDASKSAVSWAKDNAKLSGCETMPIRWIVDDVVAFVKRELKRGEHYDGIVMDPPAFGHGPKGELWKIEDHLVPLFESAFKLLSDDPLFFMISGYAEGYSSLVFKQNLDPLVTMYGGAIEHGELTIQESESTRMLPCGVYARYARSIS